MDKRAIFILIIIFSCNLFYAQNVNYKTSLGFHYGFGHEIKKGDFSHTNSCYKLELYYTLKTARHFNYELVLQPEFNDGTHQLLNVYFIETNDPDYIEKRQKFSNLRNIKEYVLNLGFIIRKPISKTFSVYLLGSVGPMIIDNEMERLSKGFAFSDVFALGFSSKIGQLTFDVRPNIRHVSNGGLQSPNLGFTTFNMEFGFSFSI
ncbi:acyloxyacyl hydrolase [Flavobacterium sp. ZS1P14]|uniref:acyloxyacyl hydrolase n=1 Tax=Flavobacterium sp. ZS1P14 TaxID=3401729 RepID=UPI003AAC9CBF